MFRMLSHHIKESGCVSASVGGHIDHVHILVGLSRTVSIAQLIENIKTETSKWGKKASNGFAGFSWQSGYSVFSVSHSMRNSVDEYIRNQDDNIQGSRLRTNTVGSARNTGSKLTSGTFGIKASQQITGRLALNHWEL